MPRSQPAEPLSRPPWTHLAAGAPAGPAWTRWALVLASATAAVAEEAPAGRDQGPAAYKHLSIEELMDIEVTSVSRRPESLVDTASALQVITGSDIQRFGATSLPEALRLASNLHVAQRNAREWAIGSRGFTNTLANKMLVLIDGRTVYTPLFAGVWWDVQNVMLADVDRIEVISGPGATLWGSNAVNGVINVVSKPARETQGLYVEGGGGSELHGFGSARYGDALSSDVHYRVYTTYIDHDDTIIAAGPRAGDDADDAWDILQGGWRLDWDASSTALVTIQGDVYGTPLREPGTAQDPTASGGNLLSRWTQALADGSDLQLQAYYDRTYRHVPNSITENLDTWDLDFQHSLQVGARNRVVWGLGYRLMRDDIVNPVGAAILPAKTWRELASGFLQDEIAVVPDRFYLTLGSKAEQNHYTGMEYQPSGRFTWLPAEDHTVWGAVSRAVRTPARIETDFYAPRDPPHFLIGGPDYRSEVVWASELGYRLQAAERLSLSLSTFYNDYDDLRSVETVNGQLVFKNLQSGCGYGAELAADAALTGRWHVHVGYTEMRVIIWKEPGSNDPNNGATEGSDPERIATLRSSVDLPWNLSTDLSGRYVGPLENADVPGYAELDARLAWSPRQSLELSLVGQNLLHDKHAEFSTLNRRDLIERSAYAKVAWTF